MELRPLLGAMWRNRTGPILVAVQVALTLMILVNVTYIIVARIDVNGRPTGIDLDNTFWIRSEGYSTDYDQARVTQADLAELRSIPGVAAAAVISDLPQTFSGRRMQTSQTPDSSGGKVMSIVYQVTDGVEDALGVHVVFGRPLSAPAVSSPVNGSEQNAASSEVVISQLLATKLFGEGQEGRNALGKTIYFDRANRAATVVGIVERLQAAPYYDGDADFVECIVLLPSVPPGSSAIYIVRTQPGLRDEVMQVVERELSVSQPGRYIDEIQSFAATASLTRATKRVGAIILIVVACLVVAIAALGVFGLASYTVTSRTKQIGIRRAIGARRSHILSYFLVESWLITSAGVFAGAILSVLLGLKLSAWLSMDRLPLLYLAGGILLMWIIGLLAVLGPARRATTVSPATATRSV